eukprot:TRINITY_DN386_c0_g1_i1.p1 TRINITY_DN386_c0_g1~~TRINITY_DN386_c0_g1_i1.p1  ORF type:complete len:153 (-),score=36.83 TRINITY_DN386_c0_g1_i1:432-860(-)
MSEEEGMQVLFSARAVGEGIELGSALDNPRTVFPLIFHKETDFGLERVPMGSAIPPHIHEHKDEVIVMIKGSGRARVGEQTMDMKVGDVMFIPRGTEHTLVNLADKGQFVDGSIDNADQEGAMWITWSFAPTREGFAKAIGK